MITFPTKFEIKPQGHKVSILHTSILLLKVLSCFYPVDTKLKGAPTAAERTWILLLQRSRHLDGSWVHIEGPQTTRGRQPSLG